MRKIYLILFILVVFKGYATDTLYISKDKFLTVHFPSKIDMYQNNALFENLLGIKIVDNTMFIQSFESFEETNLMVKTVDKNFYSFLLIYKEDLDILEKEIVLPEQESSNLIKTTLKNDFKDDVEKIFKTRGHIKSRNYLEQNKIGVTLKGTYYSEDYFYVYFELNNTTKIDYAIKAFKFYIANNKFIAVSEQETPMDIVSVIAKDLNTENLKGKKQMVFVLNKFTITENKKLIFEMLELGDRNINFTILPSIINLSNVL